MSRYDWMGAAACAQADPTLFHTEGSGGSYTKAKQICARCPVAQQCADFAQGLEGGVTRNWRFGLWGGQAPSERVTNRKKTPRNDAREAILRLATRGGMDAYQIAEHVGVGPRTVWRTLKDHRQQMGEAA